MSDMASGEHQERFDRIRKEFRHFVHPAAQKVFNHPCRAVTQSDPDYFGRMAVEKAPLAEVGILRHNHQLITSRVRPNIGVGGRLQPDVADMLTFAIAVRECRWKDRRQILVKEQFHAGMLASLRSRSAANARQARMSSPVRSGKSCRISSSVIPAAR